MLTMRGVMIVVLTVVAVCAGAAEKSDGKKDAAKKDESPACMCCGATCGLVPTCVCEPGTKKQPKVEFETTCEPICIPACGGWPWPFGGRRDRVGCTSCCQEPCDCASRVRFCKKLKKETVDEDVPVVNRTVAYLCRGCTGNNRARCCGGAPQQRATWWTNLTWWWPRNATH